MREKIRTLFMETNKKIIPLGELQKDERGLRYDLYYVITIGELTIEGSMGHDQYAKLFGKARELLGIKCIPGFIRDAGNKYKLMTVQANYSFKKNISFGDKIVISARITNIGTSSFVVSGEFKNVATGDVCCFVEHTIVYADVAGRAMPMPADFKRSLEAIVAGEYPKAS